MASRVLVTGATGVIAIRAIPRIVRSGHRVTGVARSPEKATGLEALGARAITLDLFDRDAVARAVDGHDVVINLATHIPPTLFKTALPWEWRENDRIRREGSAILTDAAIAGGVKRFIQESFAPIYEDGGDRWIDETWPLRPTAYNRTVLDAERSAERFSAAGGEGIILRFAGFYGPDPFLREMLGIARKGWSPLPGPAGAYWSSLSHEDAGSAVAAALDVRPGTYNACDDEPLTRREFADALAAAAGAGPLRLLPGWLSAFGGKTVELLSRSQRIANAKLKAATDWAPRWRNAREGLPAAARELVES